MTPLQTEKRSINQIIEDIFGEKGFDTDNIDKSIRLYRKDLRAINGGIRDIQRNGIHINQEQQRIKLEKERLDLRNAQLIEEEVENAEEAREYQEAKDKINAMITELEALKNK